MIVLFDDRDFFDNKIGPSDDLHVKIVLIDILVPLNLKIVVRFRFHDLAPSRVEQRYFLVRLESSVRLYSRQKPSLPNLPSFNKFSISSVHIVREASIENSSASKRLPTYIPIPPKKSILIASKGVLSG
jgi:hypothetical protein